MTSCFFATKLAGPKRCSDSSSDATCQVWVAGQVANAATSAARIVETSRDISTYWPNLSPVWFG